MSEFQKSRSLRLYDSLPSSEVKACEVINTTSLMNHVIITRSRHFQDLPYSNHTWAPKLNPLEL